ncbi:RNA-binding transcriptional accessory protein [Aerococcaceae bacterium zg-BR9]|uniref:Tex family protein n=1 Tax=Aerococcaceae bacterium zg-1292 TaxID=2774330 RepID=UPI00406457A5|nr:RNA-binding transcriptional accessory protein [Aerococcaceae bacterium zg-BR9]
MSDTVFHQQISKETSISVEQVKATLNLLAEGSTIPFIARYRKEVTGSLDEVQIHTIEQRFGYLQNLSERKEEVTRLIGEQDKLTDELAQQIEQAQTLQQVEDLYRPYKQKRRTKAMIAIEQGLEPLAQWLLTNTEKHSVTDKAAEYITEDIVDIDAALTGAHEILAQWVSDNAEYREFIRKYSRYNALLVTKVKDESIDAQGVYHMYYDFSEKIEKVREHSILAINRAEKEGVLSVALHVDEAPALRYIQQRFIEHTLPHEQLALVEAAIADAYKRFIAPAIERELRNEATERADAQAIAVFGENLRNLLLTAPLKGQVIMGFDPAYRTGCKLAIINETGTVLDKAVIYPHIGHKGSDSRAGQKARWAKERKPFVDLIEKHQVTLIAIGNGTASRESEQFVSEVIKTLSRPVHYLVVSEAGASVYSASEIARQEFPEWEASERSAVSIARRVQDPLAELIKIDPKSMGVGQYQHDVAQKALTEQLDFVVNVAVNQVGVDINTASAPLLQHVSGLTKTTAQNVIALREELGSFTSRRQVKDVKRLGPKTYEQAIGFLRVVGGDNPLDQTNIHPESYDVAKKLLKSLDLSLSDIGSEEVNDVLNTLNIEETAAQLAVGAETLKDIIAGLKNPTADIRDGQATPILRSDVLSMEDLSLGMEMEGVVRNVVDFGAFVDIGVKQDGLIHISKLEQGRKVKHPSEVLSVGDIVDVEVIKLEIEKQRIGLKLKKIH